MGALPSAPMALELEQLAARLPTGTRVRVGDGSADLEQIVTFQNRFARPAQFQSLDLARRFEVNNPQPKRLILLVEDGAGALVAFGQTSDGGVFGRGDGVFRLGLRVDPAWRRRGIGGALLEALEAHAQTQGAVRQITSIRGDEPDGLAFARNRG